MKRGRNGNRLPRFRDNSANGDIVNRPEGRRQRDIGVFATRALPQRHVIRRISQRQQSLSLRLMLLLTMIPRQFHTCDPPTSIAPCSSSTCGLEHDIRLSGHLGVSVREKRVRQSGAGGEVRDLFDYDARSDADCGVLPEYEPP